MDQCWLRTRSGLCTIFLVSYLFALVLIIFRGQLHRLFNKKIPFIIAITVFEVGSVICGSAKNLDSFIIGRLICELGGIGVFMGIINIISALISRAERAFYVSFRGVA